MAQATAPYANPIVFLFLGGFLIAIAMQKVNLHRRIALQTLRAVGTHPRQIILGMMISTAFLSMWVSNTATTLMMLPIALSVLALVAENSDRAKGATVDVRAGLAAGHKVSDLIHDKDVRVFGVGLVLAIAVGVDRRPGHAAGQPAERHRRRLHQQGTGKEVGFAQWMMLGLPIVVVFIALAWLLITRAVPLPSRRGAGRQADDRRRDRRAGADQPRREERASGVLPAAFCWIVPSLLSTIGDLGKTMPWLKLFNDTVVALSAGLLLFLPPGGKPGHAVLEWKDAEEGLPWGVLLLFGGGLSLAASVASSGLDKWFGQQVVGLGVLPIVALIGAVTLIVLFLTEITSNTATAATFIPILGGRAVGIGIDPMTLLIPAALGRDLRLHAAGRHAAERDRLRHRGRQHRRDGAGRAAAQPGGRRADHDLHRAARSVGAGLDHSLSNG